MINQDTTERAFIHFSRAWYAVHKNNLRDDVLDIVSFGNWLPDGSGDGELSMVWYVQGPRLEVFHDGWFTLAGMSDLTSTLGNLGGKPITPAEFCELLTALNFNDWTEETRFGGRAYLAKAAEADRCADLDDAAARDQHPIEQWKTQANVPIFDIGERLYFYATWGDSLAADMGEGWFVGEVVANPSLTYSRVAFVLAEGEVRERDIAVDALHFEPPQGARVINAECKRGERRYYYDTSDYGWLKVRITAEHPAGGYFITAEKGHEILIVSQMVMGAELKIGLPLGAQAFNEPAPARLIPGMVDRLECPNCHTVHVDEHEDVVTCTECHFDFSRP